MKKHISLALSAVMLLNTAAEMSVSAAAEGESSKKYTHNGYSITYNVVNEWTGNQNINVTITNTGEEEICGWAVKYETEGTINGLWNGKLYYENDDTRVVASQSYNSAVKPNNSITFGYTLSGENFEFPEEMILCNEWKEAEETIEVSYKLLEDWGETYQAQVSISNNSETEINCWKLGFNLTGSISEIWDSVLLSEENGTVIVSNNETNSTIAPENKANFSFIAKKNKDETPELSDFILYENYINIEKSFEEIVPEIMGYADFSEDLLTINWYSTIEDGKFEVLKSLDNETFEVIEELENEKSYKYGEIDFEKAYFKIRQTLSDGRTAESAAVAVAYENGEFKWEYIDTDEEGIPDIYEESIGTDITNPDTDGDNLTDYEEIYLTNSDPLVYNSVNEEVSDSEADPDEDGVSNRTEIDNGTNPLLADSDYDGINDGEEAKIGTDPVSSDTDNDGIADGDELTLNLDPTSDTTDGIKDSERTTLQEIEADSEIMSEINTDENPMKVSIEFEAAGLAESSLDVSESGYSSAMSNSAIVGAIPEFSYPEGLSTGEVTVKFSVDESVKENTLGTYAEECEELKGIKRFNVFKYFEDTNMLLPIETFHDEEKGVIYTKTDCLGTYCVMDLELWMQNLGVEATTEELTETVDVSYLSAEETKDESKDEKRNIVFHLDTRKKAVTDEDYEEMKTLVKDICKDVYDNIGAVNIFLSSGDGDKLQLLNHDGYTDEITDYMPNASIDVDNGYFNVTNVLKNIKDRMEEDFEGKTLVFLVCDNKSVVGSRSLSASLLKGLSIMYNVHVSFISKDMVAKEYSYVESIRKASSAFIFNDFAVGEIKNYIYTEFEPTQFKIITANNYETVKLDSILRKDSKTDTDSDDLSDWNEINVELIEHFNSGATDKGYLTMDDMPNLAQCLEYYGDKYFYVETGYEFFKGEHSDWEEYIKTTVITPIVSDPTNEDSDEDGLLDGKYQYIEDNNGDGKKEIIAPIDGKPLQIDGPKGVWKEHITYLQNNDVPNKVEKWYGESKYDSQAVVEEWLLNISQFDTSKLIDKIITSISSVTDIDEEKISYIFDVFDWNRYINLNEPNSGIEGFNTLFQEIDALAENGNIGIDNSDILKISIKAQIAVALFGNSMKRGETIEDFFECLSQSIISDKALASLGSRFLNFKADYKNVLHAQQRHWQAYGGYNNGYDALFRTFTGENMASEKFPFTIGDMEYIIWIWRGDYLNLGAGAEVGIYSRPTWLTQDPEKLDQYFTDYNLALPMTLSLYNYGEEVESIFQWCPTEKQWWITGFNPEHLRDEVDVNKQAMICSIDFSDNVEMYEALHTAKDSVDYYYKKKYLIFDDKNHIVWLYWYKG